MDANTIEAQLLQAVADELSVAPKEVDPTAPFLTYGFDSMGVLGVLGRAEDSLGVVIQLELIFEYPSLRLLSEHLASEPWPS